MMKNKRMKSVATIVALGALLGGMTACSSQATKASENLSTAADNFEVQRKVVGINTRSGEYLFYAEGRCSLEVRSTDVVVTCKHGENDYRKHFFSQSPETFWSATQQDGIDVSVYKTRIILKPEGLIPELELSTGVQ